jgi:hypothetical protein
MTALAHTIYCFGKLKVENGNLLANSHNILNRWKNYSCQLLNVYGINYVRQAEMHTTEPLVPESG